jgi:Skp family chaperone for outer membrane proteins
LGLIFCSIFINPLLAAEKIACVDLLRITREYAKAQERNKALEEKQNAYKGEIDKKADEVKQFEDKLRLLSEKEREAKKAEYESKIKALEDFARQKEMDLRKTDFENTKEILKEIEDTVKQHAEKEGYALVLDDRSLFYQAKGMDVTDKIIEILNKNYKK